MHVRMSKKSCWNIVSRLASIEDLAGMDMLCSDKTGTRPQSIVTIESKLPWCETVEQVLVLFALLVQQSCTVHDRLYWSCVARTH